MSSEFSKTRLRFGQGMARCSVFFIPIWLVSLSFPFSRRYGHLPGLLFAATGLLAMLPYLRSRVTLLTWWLFGVLVPVAALILAGGIARSLAR
jgi:hypothetical protein